MTFQAIRSRTQDLLAKKERRMGLITQIEADKKEMQKLKNKIPEETETQLLSSSAATKARRQNAEPSTLTFQDQIDALELTIARLEDTVAGLDQEIEKLTEWN
ncbi:hypothetical protein LEL_10581 [Akanthomyces lecanii RCEF 1005]|uniref:Uncharacterized protein n=1 Tax=Akanthomyces lecanii RCEF 1005 TaxID=1081108 RepID=A0A167XLT1_CORDF|nr:hypothetical protein LEL_10581 [Akanthomyces lecanii RCEF 1005]